MFMIIKEGKSAEEEIIRKNEEEKIEGEFYYMSTRYRSLIPLINEVKAQRGDIEFIKSKIADTNIRIDNIIKIFDKQNNNKNNNVKKK